jgi:peptidoglycan/xylan/chitin deacetylase (PgdA/CDA1 family)
MSGLGARVAAFPGGVARRSRRWAQEAEGEVQRRRAGRAAGRGRGVVLLYHRVAETRADPWGNAVTPERFDQQLEALAAEMRLCSLAELSAAADSGSIPDRSLAVVFDDGYADNLTNALPAIERRQVPVTLFVATGFIGADRPYWWDELTDLLLGDGERPAALEVTLAGRRVSAPTATPEQRRFALLAVLQPLLSALPPAEVDAALDPIRAWAAPGMEAVSVNGGGPSAARPMSAAELRRFAAAPLVELGAHTRDHPRLPGLPIAAQRQQIEAGRDDLAELAGVTPRYFAFPYGDASRRSARLVREAGFERAFGSRRPSPVTTAAPRFETPRIAALEEDAASLIRRLDRAFADV